MIIKNINDITEFFIVVVHLKLLTLQAQILHQLFFSFTYNTLRMKIIWKKCGFPVHKINTHRTDTWRSSVCNSPDIWIHVVLSTEVQHRIQLEFICTKRYCFTAHCPGNYSIDWKLSLICINYPPSTISIPLLAFLIKACLRTCYVYFYPWASSIKPIEVVSCLWSKFCWCGNGSWLCMQRTYFPGV